MKSGGKTHDPPSASYLNTGSTHFSVFTYLPVTSYYSILLRAVVRRRHLSLSLFTLYFLSCSLISICPNCHQGIVIKYLPILIAQRHPKRRAPLSSNRIQFTYCSDGHAYIFCFLDTKSVLGLRGQESCDGINHFKREIRLCGHRKSPIKR